MRNKTSYAIRLAFFRRICIGSIMGSSLGCFGNDRDIVCYSLIGVTGVSLVLLLVAVIILCCVCHKKKRRRTAVQSRQQVNPSSKDPKRQALLLGEYAEVVDAITPGLGQESAAQRRSRVLLAERTPDEDHNKLEEVALSSMTERSTGMNPTALQLQLHHQSLLKRKVAGFRTRSEVVTAKPSKVGGCKIPNDGPPASGSTEHLYDSVDAVTTPEAIKPHGAQQADGSRSPHIYHVLEGPAAVPQTPDSSGEQVTPTPGNPQLCTVPPKPPRARQRMMSCVTLDSRGTGASESPQLKSVQKQLSSVVAIYEEVPDRERSASSLLLPPHVVRGTLKDSGVSQKDPKEHVYHVLEESCAAPNTQRCTGKEQQNLEKTVKVNSRVNVSQACYRENAEECTVYKTKEVGFQSQLPKIPQRMSSEAPKENRHPKQLSKTGDSSEESQCYAEPCTKRSVTTECQIFDDPAYCTQSCSGSQKLVSSTDSAIETPQFDEPFYATPSLKRKQGGGFSQSSDSLFDDPKYNKPGFRGDSPTARSLVKINDSTNSPTYGRDVLHRRLLEGDRKGVRHSSSVDHFNPSIYSSTSHLLNDSNTSLKGNSLTNLTDQIGGRAGKRVMKSTDL